MPAWVFCALAAITGVLEGRECSSLCSLRVPMAAFWSKCWNPGNHEEDLWFCWNNSHEYHNFAGKKFCLAISYSGCSSWFFLLLLEVKSMGFFTVWLLVCIRTAGWALLAPGLGEKAVTAPGVASPAIAPFVLPLIQFSVGSGSVKLFVDVVPLLCQQAPPGLCWMGTAGTYPEKPGDENSK